MAHFNVTADNRDDVIQRLVTMVLDAEPDVFDNGRYWYDKAHDRARLFARDHRLPVKRAAGILAAISPNLDATVNFEAIDEIVSGKNMRHVTGKQHAKAVDCFYRDPMDVLNPKTGPKTWAFFWNIYAPSLRERVTIDGRHADVIANRMVGWKLKRGIDTGGPGTRYESYEHVTEDAAQWLRRNGYRWMTAVQVQAIVWCHAKTIEMAGVTTRGTPRKQGVFRKGQAYV